VSAVPAAYFLCSTVIRRDIRAAWCFRSCELPYHSVECVLLHCFNAQPYIFEVGNCADIAPSVLYFPVHTVGVGAGKFLVVQRIFAQFSRNSPEKFLGHFWPPVFMRFWKRRAQFFQIKPRLAPFLPMPIFLEILQRFSQILPRFARILPYQNLSGCPCTPTSLPLFKRVAGYSCSYELQFLRVECCVLLRSPNLERWYNSYSLQWLNVLNNTE